MKDQRGTKKTPEQCQMAADLIGEGAPISRALAAAGWTPGTANKCKIPKAVLALIPAKRRKLIELGSATPKEQVEALVNGRLIENVTKGYDKGVQSAKALGSRRDIGMFQPDLQTGLIVLQCPQSLLLNKAEMLADDPDEDFIPGGK